MKTRLSIFMIFTQLLIFITTPAGAIAPEALTINATMDINGPSTAAGTFVTNGLFIDMGAASEEFFIADNTIHGVKTLAGSSGTITVKFQAQLTWTGPTTGVAQGRFVILSGTGAYHNLHGTGETYAELDLVTNHLIATYTGDAHFDNS